MHERSIAESVLDIVRQHVSPAQAPCVTSVRVRVGSLSGVVAESLAFCFEALVADTAFECARLDIERIPATCACNDCGHRFEPEAMVFLCPACRSGCVRLESGADLQVVHVELDGQDADAPERSGAMGPRE
jgi:hydrogenase nickel incorporation protein HypA/HybF